MLPTFCGLYTSSLKTNQLSFVWFTLTVFLKMNRQGNFFWKRLCWILLKTYIMDETEMPTFCKYLNIKTFSFSFSLICIIQTCFYTIESNPVFYTIHYVSYLYTFKYTLHNACLNSIFGNNLFAWPSNSKLVITIMGDIMITKHYVVVAKYSLHIITTLGLYITWVYITRNSSNDTVY